MGVGEAEWGGGGDARGVGGHGQSGSPCASSLSVCRFWRFGVCRGLFQAASFALACLDSKTAWPSGSECELVTLVASEVVGDGPVARWLCDYRTRGLANVQLRYPWLNFVGPCHRPQEHNRRPMSPNASMSIFTCRWQMKTPTGRGHSARKLLNNDPL